VAIGKYVLVFFSIFALFSIVCCILLVSVGSVVVVLSIDTWCCFYYCVVFHFDYWTLVLIVVSIFCVVFHWLLVISFYWCLYFGGVFYFLLV